MDKRDFFISYNKSDRDWAKRIAEILCNHEYTVYIQARDIRQSDDFIDKMNKFLENSKSFIAIASNNYFESDYCDKEWKVAFNKYIKSKGAYRFFAFRIVKVKMPEIIQTTVYRDLFGLSDDEVENHVLQTVGWKKTSPAMLLVNSLPPNNLPERNSEFPGYSDELNNHIETYDEETENEIIKTHEALFDFVQSYAHHLANAFNGNANIYDNWEIDRKFDWYDGIEKHFKRKIHKLKDINPNQDYIENITKLLKVEIVSVAVKTFSAYNLMATLFSERNVSEREVFDSMEKRLVEMLKFQLFSDIPSNTPYADKNTSEILDFIIPAVSQVFCGILTEKNEQRISKSTKEKITKFFEKQNLTLGALKQTLNEILLIIDNYDGNVFLIEEKNASIIDKYMQCLQNNYKDVHIYMLDTRELSDFYIEPHLVKKETSKETYDSKQRKLSEYLVTSPYTHTGKTALSSYLKRADLKRADLKIADLKIADFEMAEKKFKDAWIGLLSNEEYAEISALDSFDILEPFDKVPSIKSAVYLQSKHSLLQSLDDNRLSSLHRHSFFNSLQISADDRSRTSLDEVSVESETPKQLPAVPKREPNIKWKSIFNDSDIVYVIGGAGYGKSLFLKNIVNSFKHSDLFNKPDCLVVYGDIKDFIKGKNDYKSVIEFLRDNMINGSLMHSDELSIDLVRYYLNVGRCLILLDALDEVPKADRDEIHKRMVTFFQTTSARNKICITSRDRGFIPADNKIDVFSIPPLDMGNIDEYVDRIIELNVRKAFNEKSKPDFMAQTKTLIEKEFLNSFLVLSLLVNIYSGEQKLPDTKISLYKKCFEYITKDREIDGKKNTEYPREKIVYFLRESTFAELSTMCLPNNKDVDYDTVMGFLVKTFNKTFSDVAVLYERIDCFLKFCAERTDLFVISQKENHFRFFHRSFFEYFYARKLFNTKSISKTINSLKKFDNDSEIFELYIAICKENDIDKYYNVIETLLEKVIRDDLVDYDALNILVQFFSEIDEQHYVNSLLRLLADKSQAVLRNENRFVNADLFNKYIYSEFEETDYFFSKYISMIEKQLINLIANLSWGKIQYLISLKYSKRTFEDCDKEPCDAISTIISKKLINVSFFTMYFLDCYTIENAFQHILDVLLSYMPNIEKKLRHMNFLEEKQIGKINSIILRYNKLSVENKKIFILELVK